MAPVDGGAQRLLARGRVARAAARRAERGVEPLGDLGRLTAVRSGRPRARSPTAARRRAGRSPRPRRRWLRRGRSRSRGLARARRTSATAAALGCPGLGQRERRHRVALLGLQSERLATGGQDGERRTRLEHAADEGRGGEQLLEVVDDQQQVLGGQEADGGVVGGFAGEHDDPERLHDRRGHILGSVQRGERDEVRAVGEVRLDRAPGLHGESCLADPAGPGEREQPHRPGPQPLTDRGDVMLAADRAVGRRRQPVAARRRPRMPVASRRPARAPAACSRTSLVELAQRLCRFDAELVDEPPAGRLEHGQRVGLPSGAIERQHLQLHQALLERMRDDQRLQLAQKLAVAAQLEVELDPLDDRRQPLLLQPRSLRGEQAVRADSAERLTPPDVKRLLDPLASDARARRPHAPAERGRAPAASGRRRTRRAAPPAGTRPRD